MNWLINEIVRNGNSSAKVQSFDKTTNFIVLMDIEGDFPDGCIITGDESGESGILNGFSVADIYSSSDYGSTEWGDLDNMVVESGDGPRELVAIDEHFTGKLSQDYQSTHIVRES